MVKKKGILFLVIAVALLIGIGGLWYGLKEQPAATEQADGGIQGEITVLTQRTDIVDTVFVEYAKRFNEKYPKVKVEFEALADYEGQVKIRLNTKDYGDVLLIPAQIPVSDYPHFFEPLGTVEELEDKYLFVTEKQLEGKVYGISICGNANGFVYNKKVFAEAGVTEVPSSPEEFIEAMKKIKEKGDAIPYYTNYACGWALDQWEGNRTSVAGDPDFVFKMAYTDAPFAPGKPHYIIYKLLYDLVKEGLVEQDPMTTDWESSKVMLAEGKIGAMALGSWAVSQIQDFAADPDDIGYMPFPYTNADGKVYASSAGDYKLAINIHSPYKEAARAWLYWFIEESNYALDEGSIPPVKGSPLPATLQAFDEIGAIFITDSPAPPGEETWVDAIDNEGEIGLWQPNFKQRIVEAALGNTGESFDDIMNNLNARWKRARAKIVQ